MLNIGTLGAAAITPRALIYPCVDEPDATVLAVAARDRERARDFARHHHIPLVFDTYQQVVEDERVDIVYVPLHIPAHQEWTLRALAAGKHVLCEKSLACNAREAEAMAAAARASGRVLMEAFHYRYHPVFCRAREIYQSGVLGDISRIEARFHIPVTNPDDIRMRYETGGGVTMDIGCYPLSWVRHLTGLEPVEVTAHAQTGPPDVDVFLQTELTFPAGVVAVTSGDMRAQARFQAYLNVTGSQGTMAVTNPLVPQMGHRIELTIGADVSHEVRDRRSTYGYQLDALLAAIREGAPLATDGPDGLAQMRLIDRCYAAAGLRPRGEQN